MLTEGVAKHPQAAQRVQALITEPRRRALAGNLEGASAIGAQARRNVSALPRCVQSLASLPSPTSSTAMRSEDLAIAASQLIRGRFLPSLKVSMDTLREERFDLTSGSSCASRYRSKA